MKVRITDVDWLSTEDIVIEVSNPGRGGWEVTKNLAYGTELEGFDGENCLYVFLTYWQSGDSEVAVVHCQVDGKTRMAQGRWKDPADVEAGLNGLIEQVGINE